MWRHADGCTSLHPASDQTIDHMRVSAHTCTGRMQSFFTYGLYAIALNCGAYSVYVCALIPFTPRGCCLHFGTHIDLRIVFFFSLLYFLVIVFFSYCIFVVMNRAAYVAARTPFTRVCARLFRLLPSGAFCTSIRIELRTIRIIVYC